MRVLNVPYLWQLDNEYNPRGACNVTSLAMCLKFLEKPRKLGYEKIKQFEDELYQYMENSNLSRHSPTHLALVAGHYGARDDFTFRGSIDRCQAHIMSGNPCIIHGWFTPFGHIIVVIGFDEKGLIVHDPYGEWFEFGYRTDLSGANLHYSYDLIRRTCMDDGDFWVHYISP